MTPATLTIIILVLAIISFLMEKIPVNLTIMLTMTVLVLTGLVTPKEAISGFASTTILMLIGVMIVGSALFETGVCDKVAAVVRRYAKTERQMILAILILSSVMVGGAQQFRHGRGLYTDNTRNLRFKRLQPLEAAHERLSRFYGGRDV